MNEAHNTLFLRLAAPMQSWGTASRFQIRRTDLYPSKSGVLGILLSAMGIRREDSKKALTPLRSLRMGVRLDRAGTVGWDYHTAGAKIGTRCANGGIREVSTKKETLLSRRQYLYDASFLVVLQGSQETVGNCAEALRDPVWPVFLGRKCCVPSEPVFIKTESFNNPTEALESILWQPRINIFDNPKRQREKTLDVYIEHSPGSPAPADAILAHDVPKAFGYHSHDARWLVKSQVTVPVEKESYASTKTSTWKDPYSKHFCEVARPARKKLDNYLCVFCKSPGQETHHVDYSNAGSETNDDLRFLCKICHDACTMLEYGNNLHTTRIDPSDPKQRQLILDQIKRNLSTQRLSRRREILNDSRTSNTFFDNPPKPTSTKES